MGCPFLFTKVEHTIIWLYSSICLKEFIMTSTNTPILAGNLDPKLKSRVLFLTDVVDDVSVMKVIEDIIEINEKGLTPTDRFSNIIQHQVDKGIQEIRKQVSADVAKVRKMIENS